MTTEQALKLYVVLLRAANAVGAVSLASIRRNGLSEAEFAALEALHHKGPLLLGELQRKVLVSSGGMTYVVDRLVQKGFVERRACPTDRRAVYAALTPEGEALIERIFPAHAAQIVRAVAGLSAQEARQAAALLRRLGKHAERLADREAG